MIHRLIAYLLFLMLGGLIIVSGYAMVTNFTEHGAEVKTPLQRQLVTGNFDLGSTQRAQAIEDHSPALTLSTEDLSPQTRRLTGFFTLTLPFGIQPQLVDSNTGDHLFKCPTGSNANLYDCKLKPQYADRKVVVDAVFANSAHGAETEIVDPISLKDAFNLQYSIFGQTQIPFDVPVEGNPGLYPQDRYAVDVYYYLFWTPNIARNFSDSGYNDHYFFDAGTLGKNMVVSTSDLCPNKKCHSNNAGGTIHISIHREDQTIFYTYAVAIIPLMFAIIFFHLLFLSSDLAHRRFEEFTEALIVAVLAVLPLRAVLVPVELEGLTRVDLFLAAGLVLVVAVAVAKYALEMLQSTRPHSHGEPEGHGAELGMAPAD